MVDTQFTRALLKLTLADVRKAHPSIKTSEAGLTSSKIGPKRHFFFEFGSFHWEGVAWDAFEARAKAWNAWLEHGKNE